MDSFKEGMIVRVYCKDFRTYTEAEFFPGAKLNMITGPNGTGKSSLVYAIVLGLGGKPTVIGSEKQLSSYVRRGCRTAEIQIELYSEPSNYVIGRTFTVDNKTNWTVNGQHSTLKMVESIIKEMNIQVDNLCQFLPQDKVQDFAKMDSKQLLENTMKTVGSKEVVDLHLSLKELRKNELSLDEQTKTKREILESERKKIMRLESEVKAIKEREEILNSIKTVEKKVAWVEFDEIEVKRKEILKDKEKVTGMMKKAEQDLTPFEVAIEEVREQIKAKDKLIKREIKMCGDITSTLRRIFDSSSSLDDKIHNVESELNRTIDAQRRKEHTIQSLEAEIQSSERLINPQRESELNTLMSEHQKRLARETIELKDIQRRMIEVEEAMSEVTRNKLKYESALAREMSAANRKEQILAHRFRDAHQAYTWLTNNRDKFRGRVYGPIMLEINCSDKIAKYVEFTIPHRDLSAFVCENKDDMNKLMRTLRDEAGLRINVVQAPAHFNTPVSETYYPPQPLENIKQYGFWSYLIDEMEGPDAVLNYLCHTYNLHRIPVGNDLTNKMLDAIPSQMFSFFFSDTLNYMVRTSKFSGEKTSRVVKVNQSVLLAGSTNTKLIMEYNESIASENEKLARFKTSLVEIKSDQSLKEKQINGLREAKFGLEHELHNLRTSKARLQMKKQELDIFIKQNTIDIESEKMKAKAEIKRLVMEMSDKQQVAKVTLSQYQNSMKTNLYEKFKLSRLQDVLKNKERESMAASKKLEDIKKMLSNLQEQLKIDERNSRTAYDKALKLTDNLSPNDARFKKKYSKAFSELPDSIDGLEKELSQLNARADCLAGRKASSLEEYDKTKKAIRHLEAQVANPELKLQELRQEMQEKKEAWLPQVEELTNRINKKFSQFFAQMKCVGEVSLEIPEVEDEYSKYGVCIKVQFREQGRLQQLGPHSQSGGERAVSTAIYMLALQELTTVPFRCLDEINQGMDERNERTVFDLLVKTVEKADSAQCFLLTPKILRALDYSTFVKVHCVTHSNSAIEKHFDAKMLLNMMNQQNRSMTIGRSVKRKHQDSDSDSSN